MTVLGREDGFTLLESLFQLVIAIAFLHLIVLFLLFKDASYKQLTDSKTIEWELFMIDMQKDLEAVTAIDINAGGSVLNAYSEEIGNKKEYSSVGGVIRRRIGNQGHVPLLTSVHSVQFIEEGTAVTVIATLQNGTKRQRSVSIGFAEK
ncbi:competence type IV pilus minor pilin ComGF [Sporosarcina aquimarina]|uniref:Competence type IV pilus minor pilin ComGF n=1 Tax=Sporosarcina aquimarina TaxID=114975 RepID=A0ABU4FW46_9BACL|nr:competence type IV pilus minor pilin ComGF [Sporosarcina aquimarina]MDW0108936.1 competence type IV pilus minor pilin ComGF [Sporosarcina aquimarina]